MVAIVIMSVPDPFYGFNKIKHNSAISCQIRLEFLNWKVKDNFSLQPQTFC